MLYSPSLCFGFPVSCHLREFCQYPNTMGAFHLNPGGAKRSARASPAGHVCQASDAPPGCAHVDDSALARSSADTPEARGRRARARLFRFQREQVSVHVHGADAVLAPRLSCLLDRGLTKCFLTGSQSAIKYKRLRLTRGDQRFDGGAHTST